MLEKLKSILGINSLSQKAEDYINLEKENDLLKAEIEELAEDFSITSKMRESNLSKSEGDDFVKAKIEEKYENFLKEHLQKIGLLRKKKKDIESRMSKLNNDETLSKAIKELKQYIASESIKKAFKSKDINSNTYNKILKAKEGKVHYSDVVLFNEEGKFLVIQRTANSDFEPNKWCLPGGHVDMGEGHLIAAKRELMEETHIDAIDFERIAEYEDKDSMIEYYKAKTKSPDPIPTLESSEHVDFKWVTWEEFCDLPTLLNLKDNLRKVFDPFGNMVIEISKAYKNGDISKERFLDIIEKAKYIRREGAFGKYKYTYPKEHGTDGGHKEEVGDKEINIKNIKDEAKRIINGEQVLERLSREEEQGRNYGSPRNVEATIILTREKGSSQVGKGRDIDRDSQIRDNSKKVTQWLKDNGFEKKYINKEGTSVYWGNEYIGKVRVSDHNNQSMYYDNAEINAFSDKKDGYIDIINDIKSLQDKIKEVQPRLDKINNEIDKINKEEPREQVFSDKYGEGELISETKDKMVISFDDGIKELFKNMGFGKNVIRRTNDTELSEYKEGKGKENDELKSKLLKERGEIISSIKKLQKAENYTSPLIDELLSQIDPEEQKLVEEEMMDEMYLNIITKAFEDGRISEEVLEKAQRVYADNAQNRKLKRVGRPYGSAGQQEQVSSKDKKQEDNKEQSDKPIEEHAKEASGTALENASKNAKDPEVRTAAHAELDRREKEEKPQEEEKETEKKEEPKENKPKPGTIDFTIARMKESGFDSLIETGDGKAYILNSEKNEKWPVSKKDYKKHKEKLEEAFLSSLDKKEEKIEEDKGKSKKEEETIESLKQQMQDLREEDIDYSDIKALDKNTKKMTEIREKIVSLMEAEKNKEKEKLSESGLSKEEIQSLVDYTGSEYQEINKSLRKDKLSTEQQDKVNKINNALSKLPEHKGKVYRGMSIPEDIGSMMEEWKKGGIVNMKALTSSSKEKNKAKDFGDFQMEIESKSGRDVSGVSEFGKESEVLFKTGAKFKVKSIKVKKDKDQIVSVEVKLSEI